MPLRLSAAAVAEFADIVIVAVKPYQVRRCDTRPELLAKKIVVSVARRRHVRRLRADAQYGTTLSTIPNTPVSRSAKASSSSVTPPFAVGCAVDMRRGLFSKLGIA